MVATEINKEGMSLWCRQQPLKWPGSAWMWLHSTLKKFYWTIKEKERV